MEQPLIHKDCDYNFVKGIVVLVGNINFFNNI